MYALRRAQPDESLGMTCLQTFCAKITDDDWLVLSERPNGGWTFLIWGSQPHYGDLGPVPESDAKLIAIREARAYLAAHGRSVPKTVLAPLRWRVAVRQFTNA